MSKKGGQVAVIGGGAAAALHMAQHGDAHFLTCALLQHPLHVGAADVITIAIACALRHDNDVVAASCFGPGLEPLDQHVLPVIHIRRGFRDQDPIRSGSQGGMQSQVAAITAHDLDNKSTLVTGGSACNGIHRIGDAVQGAIRTDGHLGAIKIVVYGTDHSDDEQVGMCGADFGADLTVLNELRY